MTVSTGRRLAADARVPGVYHAPQPRAPESPVTRTDVVGFVGFDPRRGAALPTDPVARHRPVRCDDWNDYLLGMGLQEIPDDGTLLSAAVRAYFMNGGRRCHVALVAPPDPDIAEDVERARRELVGVRGASANQATGLERLLLVDEVAIIDVPDLYARRAESIPVSQTLGGSARNACFQPCDQVRGPVGPVAAQRITQLADPWFPADLTAPNWDADPAFRTQRDLVARCRDERWRVLLLLSVPATRNVRTGEFAPPSPQDANTWRRRFASLVENTEFATTEQMSCAALYYPWVVSQERVGAPTSELPPSAFAAGVLARRDLARGPHVAPANETVRGVVQLTWPIDDDTQARLQASDPADVALGDDTPAPSINLLRAFPGYGIQIWGARSLSTDRWLGYLSVRRCLTAIERRVKFALDALVFEPNTPILWLQVTQIVFSTLTKLFEAGALRGDRIEQAFYVRCDASTNSSADIQAGHVVCEVGVAIAAPAEFLMFRLGRREGVVEVVE